MKMDIPSEGWMTKPTDRFVLKWIKCNLSARITPRLLGLEWLRPWMITAASSSLGVAAGLAFALGNAWLGGLIAALSQVLDGVDGQFARLTNRQSKAGAFFDSVLDRYSDGALVIGLTIWVGRLPHFIPLWQVAVLGSLALIGSGLISYSSARAESLGIDLGEPTLASKGTRTSAVVLCGLASVFWAHAPVAALLYLVIHPNLVVAGRLSRALKGSGRGK